MRITLKLSVSVLLVCLIPSLLLAAGLTNISSGHECLDNYPNPLPVLNGKVFLGINGATGYEPYMTDGSAGGTTLLKEISSSGSSYPSNPVLCGSWIVFWAMDDTYGMEVWCTDGTETNTVRISDINSGAGSSSSTGTLIALNGWVYFSATDGGSSTGNELYRAIPGASGYAELVKDINPGSGNSDISELTLIGNKLFFRATDGTNGTNLWVSDGTTGGTTQLYESGTTDYVTNPQYFTECNGSAVFLAWSTGHGDELWVSDGTSDGTELVLDLTGDANTGILSQDGFVNVGGEVYFWGTTDLTYYNLYKTDGTTGGTSAITTWATNSFSDYQHHGTANGLYFFDFDDGTHGEELWVTDGTSSGTEMLMDWGTGDYGSYPDKFFEVNGIMYFVADNSGEEDGFYVLCRSDGTAAGTYEVYADAPVEFYNSPGYTSDLIIFTGNNSSTTNTYCWPAAPKKTLTRNTWVMMGAPVHIYTGCESPGDLFQNDLGSSSPNGSNWMMSRWDPTLDCYVRYGELDSDGADHGDPDNVAAGLGYWMIQDVSDDGALQINDNQSDGECDCSGKHFVDLYDTNGGSYRGLTMLANPYPYSVKLQYCTVKYGAGDESWLFEMVAGGIISNNVYTWNPDAGISGQYVTTAYNSITLDPWEGFWMEVLDEQGFSNLQLGFAPSGSSGPAKRGDDPVSREIGDCDDTEAWTLGLPVRSSDDAYLDEYNRIGIDPLCQDQFDQYDASEFQPPNGRFVQAYFDHPEWTSLAKQFTFDMRNSDFSHGAKEWQFTVRTWRLPDREFIVEWPEISQIDRDYVFTLIDNSSGEPVELDMRNQTSLTFQTGPHTGDYDVHTWTIRVEYNPEFSSTDPEISLVPTSYEFAPAYPNPFNPTSTLTIALPQTSKLNVQVFNLLGQHVATLADGQYKAGYQRIIFDGGNLASGTYLVRAEVPGKLDVTRKVQLVK